MKNPSGTGLVMICNMFCRWAARYDDTNTHSIKMLLGGLVHGEVLPRDEANLSAVKFDLKKAPQSQLSILFLSDTRPIWIFLHIWHSFTWFCVKYYTIDSIYIYIYTICSVPMFFHGARQGSEVYWLNSHMNIMNIDFRINNIYIYIYIYIVSGHNKVPGRKNMIRY